MFLGGEVSFGDGRRLQFLADRSRPHPEPDRSEMAGDHNFGFELGPQGFGEFVSEGGGFAGVLGGEFPP